MLNEHKLTNDSEYYTEIEETPVNETSLKDHLSRLKYVKSHKDFLQCGRCDFEWLAMSERFEFECPKCGESV